MQRPKDMDDMTYLIHLEAFKRFKEEEGHIKRMVEKKTNEYNKVKGEYLNLYSKYVEMLKLCATRGALTAEKFQDDDNIQKVTKSIDVIGRNTSVDQQVELLQTKTLELTKKIVGEAPGFKHMAELHEATANNKSRLESIQSALARVESKLETSIESGLDSFVEKVKE